MPIKSKKKTPSFKKEISNYILKKGDICCEEDFERDKVIEQIFNVYEEKEKMLKIMQNSVKRPWNP